jgi:hypothetical protein
LVTPGRHGNEEKLVTLYGLMQALVFCVKDNDDEIKSITAGDYLIVFLAKGPLIFVVVSRRGETATQLTLHLRYGFLMNFFFSINNVV